MYKTPLATADVKITPSSYGVDHNNLTVGKWKVGLLDCMTHDFLPNCIMPMLCPCISVAQIVHRIGLYKYSLAMMVSAGLFLSYVMFAVLEAKLNRYFVIPMWLVTFCAIYLLAMVRQKVRQVFQIPGSYLEDSACSCIFSCCAIGQMASHVESYIPGSCHIGPKDTLPGYHEYN